MYIKRVTHLRDLPLLHQRLLLGRDGPLALFGAGFARGCGCGGGGRFAGFDGALGHLV